MYTLVTNNNETEVLNIKQTSIIRTHIYKSNNFSRLNLNLKLRFAYLYTFKTSKNLQDGSSLICGFRNGYLLLRTFGSLHSHLMYPCSYTEHIATSLSINMSPYTAYTEAVSL